MEIRKAIAGLRRELNDLDRMIASIEDRMAANVEKRQRKSASRKATRELISQLTRTSFQEPEFGLWLQ